MILQKEAENGYIARPVLRPDSTVHGETEQEALERVRTLIRELFQQTKLVQVDVELSEKTEDNPWVKNASIFAEDPSWDSFLEEMELYRQQSNET